VGEASAAAAVTVANSGSADVTINGISITGTNAGEFMQTNTCGATLAANGACTISVVFTPTVAAAQTATLSIADNATGSPQTVTLTGNETVYPPDPVWSPTQLIFGPQAIGSTSPAQTATFTNQGKGPLTITSISLDPQYYAQTNNCGTTLAAGASCLFHVTFTPPVTGPINSGIFIRDNATDSPQVLEFSGTGVAVTVGVSPASLSFANQAVGSSSAVQTVTLTNGTTAAATIPSIGVTGDFAETNNCNGTVPANGGCSLLVTFSPTAAGARNGVLTITDVATGLRKS
jgi:hypothetical protein